MESPHIKFKIRDDLSLAELRRMYERGVPMMRSAHVGNVYPSNLAVGAAGIPLNLYDRTVGYKDENYHPHQCIMDGRADGVAPADIMTSHAQVTHSCARAQDRFKQGVSVVDVHVGAMRELFPNTSIEVYSEWLFRHRELIMEMVGHLAVQFPQVWTHRVTKEGKRARLTDALPWRAIQNEGLYGVTNTKSGVLVPNRLNALFDCVIEALVYNTQDVYHLSGPDMYKYLRGIWRDVEKMYESLFAHMPHLPQRIMFHIVPVAQMRLVTTMDRRANLDAVVEAWCAMHANNRHFGAQIKKAVNGSRPELIARAREAKTQDEARLSEAIARTPEIFYEINKADFISQYDALARGLYVHPWMLEQSTGQIDAMIKALERLRARSFSTSSDQPGQLVTTC